MNWGVPQPPDNSNPFIAHTITLETINSTSTPTDVTFMRLYDPADPISGFL